MGAFLLLIPWSVFPAPYIAMIPKARICIIIVIIGVSMLAFADILPDPTGEQTTDKISAAQTAFGEARGEPWSAKLGVVFVILNRKKAHRSYFGFSIRGIVRQRNLIDGIWRYQFSVWNRNDPNYKKMHKPIEYESVDTWLESYMAAHLVLSGKVKDNTGGAMWYIDESIIDHPPVWVSRLEQSAQHGKLYFFREKK